MEEAGETDIAQQAFGAEFDSIPSSLFGNDVVMWGRGTVGQVGGDNGSLEASGELTFASAWYWREEECEETCDTSRPLKIRCHSCSCWRDAQCSSNG